MGVKISSKLANTDPNIFFRIGRFIAKARANLLAGFYSIHIKIRYAHDATYAKNKAYKGWSDKRYSSAVHKSVLAAFVVSFIFFSVAQNIFPFLDLGKPSVVQAGANTKTWTTTEDFSGGVINPSYLAVSGSGEGGYLRLNVDESLSSLDANLGTGAQGDVTINSSVNINTLVAGYNPGAGVVPNFRNLTITPTGTLTTSQGVPLELRVSENLIIESGGKIDATGMGYQGGGLGNQTYGGYYLAQPGFGPGGGGRGFGGEYDAGGGGGGGYGSVGGLGGVLGWDGGGGAGGPAYSNFPAFGSGGGSAAGFFYSNNFGNGGAGGGIVKINAQNISLSGNILASGLAGSENNYGLWGSGHGGGGSGGSVFIYTPNTLNNINNVIAIGGVGGNSSRSCPNEGTGGGGGGAGGRIKIVSSIDGNTPNLSTTVRGGLGGIECITSRAGSGGTGTYNKMGIIKNGEASGYRVTVAAPVKPSWSTISFNGNQDPNGASPTFIKFQTRGTNVTNPNESTPVNQVDPNNGWTTWQNVVGSNIQTQSTQTLEVKVILESNSGINTPTLNDFTVTYDTLEAPVNNNLILTKTDGTSLKSNTGTTITGGVSGAYTNESSLRVTANNLTCGGGDSGNTACAIASTNLRPEVQASTSADFSNPISATAAPGTSYATLTGLTSGVGYHLRVRAIDDQGRVSGWTSYGGNAESAPDFSIDQTAPTGTVTINSGAQFATSPNVTLTLSATDTGGSSLQQMRFSNDGTFDAPEEDWFTYATTAHWTLTSGDGEKTVYGQFRDNAGNVSENIRHSTESDFAGTLGDLVLKTGGDISLSSAGYTSLGTQRLATNFSIDDWSDIHFDSNLITNSNADKFRFLGATSGNYITVFDIYANNNLMSTYTNGASFQPSGIQPFSIAYNSAATSSWYNGQNARILGYSEGTYLVYLDIEFAKNSFPVSGTYTSQPISNPSLMKSINWNDKITTPYGGTVTMQVRGGNDSSLTGATSWVSVTKGAVIPSTENINTKPYLQYKLTLSSGDNQTTTPIVYDVSLEAAIGASITLDTNPPANITGLKAYADISKSSELNASTWYPISQPYFEWDANTDSDFVEYKYCFDTSASCTPQTSLSTNALAINPAITFEGTHYLRVVAIDQAGQSSTTPITFVYKYDATAPGAVTGLSATITELSKIRVTWNAYGDGASPVEHYKLERVKDSGNQYQIGDEWTTEPGYAIFILAGTSFDDTAIEAATKYQYRIQVKDVSNASYSLYNSTKAYGMTNDLRDPDPVINVQSSACDGTANTISGTTVPKCSDVANKGFEIAITWMPTTDSGTGIGGYNIYRSTTAAIDSYTKIGTVNGSITNFYYDNDVNNDTNGKPRLNDFTTYYYRITAFDAATTPNETDLIPVGTDNTTSSLTPDVTKPSAPADVTASALGIDSSGSRQKIQLTWSATVDVKARNTEAGSGIKTNSGDIVGYKIYRASALEGPYTDVTADPKVSCDQNARICFNEDLDEYPAIYYYKITATDNYDNLSSDSVIASVRTASSAVPTAPASVKVTTKTGDPNTDEAVGHENSITFNGSFAKNCANNIRCLTKYELWRATTNYTNAADWIDPAKATKVKEFTPSVIGDDRGTTYNHTDINLTNATTYYYKIRALDNTPSEPDGGPFYSPLSTIATGTLHAGWDTTADDEAPKIPEGGLQVKVRDTHPSDTEYRNIITWVMLTEDNVPTRNGQSDFARYELHREVLAPGTDEVLSDTKVAEVKNVGDNYYIDIMNTALGALRYRYYVLVVDDADTNFKYFNGTIINNSANYSTREYASDTITPNLTTPTLTEPVRLSSVGVASAVVTWQTDQDTDSIVEFRPKGSTGEWSIDGKVDRTQNHETTLVGMQPNTTYEYRIVSRNYLGNNVDYDPAALPDLRTTGFNISPKSTLTTTSTAEITWVTNLDASSSFIEYQLQRQPGDEAQSGTAGVSPEDLLRDAKNHKVVIKGLRSNRAYTYKIKSISKDGYLAEYPTGGGSNFETFRTKAYDAGQFTLAPSSSNVAERNITSTNAQIIWETALPTTTWVDYGTKSGVYDVSAGNNDLTTQHVVLIDGLTPGETYYYRVRVKDQNEIEYTSQEYSFRAVLKPKVSGLQISEVTPYSVTIRWETNIETETLINWGKTTAYGEKKGSTGSSKQHELKIEDLEDNSEYHFQILARDETGAEVAADDNVVRTPLDKEGPKVENVKIDILPLGEGDDLAQVIISWRTNKPATTLVQYDIGLVGGNYAKSSVEDKTLTNAHTVIIKDLEVASTYHYRIVARDKRENTTISNDFTFVTPEKNKSIWQLIVRSLEDTFSWVKNVGSFFRNIGKKAQ